MSGTRLFVLFILIAREQVVKGKSLDAYRVTLDARLLSAVEQYADITGVTTESCLEEAVTDWLTTTAFARIEARTAPRLAAAS